MKMMQGCEERWRFDRCDVSARGSFAMRERYLATCNGLPDSSSLVLESLVHKASLTESILHARVQARSARE
jgi:hypothetical protein